MFCRVVMKHPKRPYEHRSILPFSPNGKPMIVYGRHVCHCRSRAYLSPFKSLYIPLYLSGGRVEPRSRTITYSFLFAPTLCVR